jgi:hypothetical protein
MISSQSLNNRPVGCSVSPRDRAARSSRDYRQFASRVRASIVEGLCGLVDGFCGIFRIFTNRPQYSHTPALISPTLSWSHLGLSGGPMHVLWTHGGVGVLRVRWKGFGGRAAGQQVVMETSGRNSRQGASIADMPGGAPCDRRKLQERRRGEGGSLTAPGIDGPRCAAP